MVQINIDKKTGSLVAIIVVLLGIILGFSISRNSDEGFFGIRGNADGKNFRTKVISDGAHSNATWARNVPEAIDFWMKAGE